MDVENFAANFDIFMFTGAVTIASHLVHSHPRRFEARCWRRRARATRSPPRRSTTVRRRSVEGAKGRAQISAQSPRAGARARPRAAGSRRRRPLGAALGAGRGGVQLRTAHLAGCSVARRRTPRPRARAPTTRRQAAPVVCGDARGAAAQGRRGRAAHTPLRAEAVASRGRGTIRSCRDSHRLDLG